MKKRAIWTILLASIFYGFVNYNLAHAASSGIIMDKAYMEGIHTCYNIGKIRTGRQSSSPITMDEFPVFPVAITSSLNEGNNDVVFKNQTENIVLLPSNLSGITDDNVNCNELFVGYNGSGGNFAGILNMKGVTNPSADASASEKTNFMETIGYTASSSDDASGICSAIVLNKTTTLSGTNTSTTPTRTNKICGKNLNDGEIASSSIVFAANSDGGDDVIKFSSDLSGTTLTVSYSEIVNQPTSTGLSSEVTKNSSDTFNLSDYQTWNKLVEAVAQNFAQKKLGSCTSGGGDGGSYTSCTTYEVPTSDYYTNEPYGEASTVFTIPNVNAAANTAIKNLSTEGLTGYDSLMYTQAEKASLYQSYLTDIFEIEFEDGSGGNCAEVSESTEGMILAKGYIKVRWNTNNGARTCFVKSAKESSVKSVNGIKSDGHFGAKIETDAEKTAFRKLLDELNSIELEDGEYEDDALKKDNENKNKCLTSGGAGNLGYIICNVLDMVGSATTEIYNNAVKPALEVQPSLFRSGESSGTYQAWEVFQNIANIAFIIMVLFVIFSQVTGVGIDNYGIKKIMPKLIIAAVLINLSYIICQLCVDLSNIAGNGIQGLFDNIKTSLSLNNLTLEGADSGINLGTEIGVGLLFALAVGGAALMAWTAPAMVLSLLVGALGVLISILFVFALLAARQAALVVLTVISPLAFACYMLPNTKKLFDKWVKLGEGLLLVYPICGLLIGGGDFVGRLLLNSGVAGESFWSALIAMLASIVPIFFIPTVLKSSFAAFGKVGATLSGLGDRARSGATSKIKGSDSYKAAKEQAVKTGIRRKAGFDKDGKVTRTGALKARFARSTPGRLIGYQAMQASRTKAYEKNREEDIQAAASLGDAEMLYLKSQNPELSTSDILQKEFDKAAEAGNASRMFAVVEQAKKSMQASQVAKMTRSTFESGKLKMKAGDKKNFLEEFGHKYGGDFLKKDYEQADWARKGGIDGNSKSAAGLTGWAQGNIEIDDLKDEDVSALSADNLHNLIKAQKISQSQAQRVWAGNGNMDDTSRLILGTFGNGGTNLTKADAQTLIRMKNPQAMEYIKRSPQDVNIVGGSNPNS